MSGITITEVAPQHTAVVRADVAAEQLPEVFHRAFGEVMATVARQGVAVVGPPFGYYPRMPDATVEVAAGFPVSAPVTPSGEVTNLELPGGRAVVAVHRGPFETLAATYDEITRWAATEGVTLGGVVWESYLTDPTTEPDPTRWETRIVWPLG